MVGYTGLGTWQSQPNPLPSLYGREGSSLSWCVPPNDMFDSKSVVGIKLGDSRVENGYQVDEFTYTWSAECIIPPSHIAGFIGKVSTLTHFMPEPGCEDYSFLNQAFDDFEHCHYSILAESVEIPEPDASFDDLCQSLRVFMLG